MIEDCAHSLGASYHGQLTGTFGDAALFSFQMLKGLNAYGGGMAITSNDVLGERIRRMAESEAWPSIDEVRKRIQIGELTRGLISPKGFTFGLFIGFYLGSFLGGGDLSRFLWEKIRPLDPLPQSYRRRFSNAQAVVALQGLENLESCDVALLFTRRLTIKGEQLERVKKYCQSGKPIVAVRTASHGFHSGR